MKLSRKSKWLVLSTLLILFLIWIGHRQWEAHERQLDAERRKLTLVGTWDIGNRGRGQAFFRSYRIFNGDGTGETIFEENGKRAHIPFTYVVTDIPPDTGVGFFELEITCDWIYWAGRVVALDNSSIPKNARQERVTSFPIYIGLERNRVALNPYGTVVGTETFYWSRVELNLLPGEVDTSQMKIADRRLRLIGTWDVVQEAESNKNPRLQWYYEFHRDGTGRSIFEENGKRQEAPFTYTFSESQMDSRLEITCDWIYCGGRVVPLDDPSIPTDIHPERVVSFSIFFGSNRARVYRTPDLSDAAKGTTYWQRVKLMPSQTNRTGSN